MAKTYKYDLKALLTSIKYKNEKYYRSLSEEEQKAVSPLITMRAMTATTDARQIYFLNELVNSFVFPLGKHKELLFDLMTLCASDDGKYRKNSKPLTKKSSNTPKSVKIIQEYFGYSTIKSIESLKLISDEHILNMSKQLGKTDKEIKDIKKELKLREK